MLDRKNKALKMGLVVLLVSVAVFFYPRISFALTAFGGRIIKVVPFICLLPAPPPIFTIPTPGFLITVGLPRPTVTFFIPGISRLYKWYALKPGNWTLGISKPTPWLNCPPFTVDKEGTSLTK